MLPGSAVKVRCTSHLLRLMIITVGVGHNDLNPHLSQAIEHLGGGLGVGDQRGDKLVLFRNRGHAYYIIMSHRNQYLGSKSDMSLGTTHYLAGITSFLGEKLSGSTVRTMTRTSRWGQGRQGTFREKQGYVSTLYQLIPSKSTGLRCSGRVDLPRFR